MDNDEIKALAKQYDKSLGDIVVIFIAIVNALRKQPAFHDAKFRAEIQTLLERHDLSDVQRQALLPFLSD